MSNLKEKGVAVSSEQDVKAATVVDTTAVVKREDTSPQLRQALGGLSRETVDKLSLELSETLHQVTMPLEDRVKASKIHQRGESFMIIDATTIRDFEEKRTGDISDKHVFVLEFATGDVEVIMQSDAKPRRRLADMFSLARSLGRSALAGPYRIEAKAVGQAQDALIFEKQPGFQARVL